MKVEELFAHFRFTPEQVVYSFDNELYFAHENNAGKFIDRYGEKEVSFWWVYQDLRVAVILKD